MRKDSSGKPAAATISKTTASKPPSTSMRGKMGTGGLAQPETLKSQDTLVTSRMSVWRDAQRKCQRKTCHHLTAKPSRDFRQAGGQLLSTIHSSSTQGVQPFNGNHSPVLILPEGQLTWTSS